MIRDHPDEMYVSLITNNTDVMIRSNGDQLPFSRPKMDQVINRYPKNIVKVARKDLFHKIISIGESFYPDAFDFVPRTFFFPDDY